MEERNEENVEIAKVEDAKNSLVNVIVKSNKREKQIFSNLLVSVDTLMNMA